MRKILFRGKTKKGEWCEGLPTRKSPLDKEVNRIQLIDDYLETDFTELFLAQDVLPETVGQYTGLTDKNGKKIFEGDIVNFSDILYYIVFADGCFRISRNGQYSYTLHNLHSAFEIVGNIHDNSELLKGGEQ